MIVEKVTLYKITIAHGHSRLMRLVKFVGYVFMQLDFDACVYYVTEQNHEKFVLLKDNYFCVDSSEKFLRRVLHDHNGDRVSTHESLSLEQAVELINSGEFMVNNFLKNANDI